MAQPPSTESGSGHPLQAGDAFEIHRQMVIALFTATLIVSVALAAGLIASRVTALMVVAAGGALGGFVSALRRLYAFQRVFPENFFRSMRRINLYLIVYSMIPSLVGAIGAVVLYMVFASGLVKGDLFPAFELAQIDPKRDEFQNFISNWQPAAAIDYAKALVWSFIAGFSERFVPDLLDRFASSQRQDSDRGAGR